MQAVKQCRKKWASGVVARSIDQNFTIHERDAHGKRENSAVHRRNTQWRGHGDGRAGLRSRATTARRQARAFCERLGTACTINERLWSDHCRNASDRPAPGCSGCWTQRGLTIDLSASASDGDMTMSPWAIGTASLLRNTKADSGFCLGMSRPPFVEDRDGATRTHQVPADAGIELLTPHHGPEPSRLRLNLRAVFGRKDLCLLPPVVDVTRLQAISPRARFKKLQQLHWATKNADCVLDGLGWGSIWCVHRQSSLHPISKFICAQRTQNNLL